MPDQVGTGSGAKLGKPDPIELLWKQPWRIGVLVGLIVVLAVVWRGGATIAKWFIGLLIVGTILARWNNTIRPWLMGGS